MDDFTSLRRHPKSSSFTKAFQTIWMDDFTSLRRHPKSSSFTKAFQGVLMKKKFINTPWLFSFSPAYESELSTLP
jgi:lysozyme family protein